MNDRITAIKERVLHSRQTADPKTASLREESLAMTEGKPEVIREAEAIAHYFRHQAVHIQDGELLVGSKPGLSSDPDDIVVPGIAGRRPWVDPWPATEEVGAFFNEGVLCGAGNHTTLHYEHVFSVGFTGLIDQINERLDRLSSEDSEYEKQRDFLEALKIVAEGYIDFSHRYADLALQLSAEADSPDRKIELETIAANCRRVPAEPPRNFWEACQCAWFLFFFLPDAPGRLDQYLYPSFKQDTESGSLNRDFAKELLSCLWIKYFESSGPADGVSARHHMTLGGVKPDGSDGSNDLTYLCLEVTGELRLIRPQVGFRWHKNAPPELLKHAVRCLRSNTSCPDFCSDEQIVPALSAIGVSVEDARDFSLSGCHEVIISGRAQMGSVEGFINMPKVLRMALGLEPALQNGNGISAVDSMEALWEHLKVSIERVAEMAHQASLGRDSQACEMPGGNLNASLVTHDCIENAVGYTQGGARYNYCNWDIIGLANIADSLTAIRNLVFEEQLLSLQDFIEIISSDWEGQEPLRRKIDSEYLRYGNDRDESDEIASRIINEFSSILKRHTPFRGGEYILGTTAGGENMHVEFGRMTGATPDGRRSGEPLADSIGAGQGRDRNGVTALLNSVAKLPHRLLPTATTLNVKIGPRMLDGDEGIERIAAMIEAHFMSGGQQMQFSIADRETLIDAKLHPEKHSDLIVRVAGYSAPFTSLWDDLQDEIIARTSHELAAVR